jgi:hypothetical protein
MSNLLQEIEAQITGANTAVQKQNVGIVREISDGVCKIRLHGQRDVGLRQWCHRFGTEP